LDFQAALFSFAPAATIRHHASMIARLAILFVVVPFVELALLMFLADATDWKVSLGLVVATGLAGAWLVKNQGWRVLRNIRAELAAGRVPAGALVDGALVLVAGTLLLTPGVLTDLVAIGLLVPFTRTLAKRRLIRWFQDNFTLEVAGQTATFRYAAGPDNPSSAETRDADARTIDGRTIDGRTIDGRATVVRQIK
jgi:UPF0716 protein FxsA